MALASKFAGVVSIAVGALLCLPAGGAAWDTVIQHQHDLAGVSMTFFGGGTLGFTGSHTWVFVSGLALFGAAFLVLGLYALLFSSPDS